MVNNKLVIYKLASEGLILGWLDLVYSLRKLHPFVDSRIRRLVLREEKEKNKHKYKKLSKAMLKDRVKSG